MRHPRAIRRLFGGLLLRTRPPGRITPRPHPRWRHALALAAACALAHGPLAAQEAASSTGTPPDIKASDPLMAFIKEMEHMHGGRTLCFGPGMSLAQVRDNVIHYLATTGHRGDATAEMVARTLWQLFPCPFTPYRKELRLATREQIEGVWLYPESSHKLRYGPTVARVSPYGDGQRPVRCEVIGLYAGGEHRVLVTMDAKPCQVRTAADMEAQRRLYPPVVAWHLADRGRLVVTRADVPDHVEEWDTYVVTEPFTWDGVAFERGDLLAYLRRARDNEVGASVQFRHLKRLP